MIFFQVQSLLNFLTKKNNNDIVDRNGKIKFLLDKSPIPAWILDQNMILQYCNFAYADLMDTTPDVILQKQIPFYQLNNVSHALARHAVVVDSQQSTTVPIIIAGKRRIYEITETPTFDGKAIVGYAIDYTNIDEVQSNLERHVQASQDIYEFLGSAVAIFGSSRTLQFYNHAFVQMWQLEEEWLAKKPTMGELLDHLRRSRMIPESLDFQNIRQQYYQMFNTLLEAKQEIWHLPDERTIKIIIVPHPLGGLFFSYENVTDRFTLERNYKSLTLVHNTIIHSLSEGVIIVGSDGRIKMVNDFCLGIFSLEGSSKSYEDKRIHEVLGVIKPLLIRNLPQHKWPVLQKKISSFIFSRNQYSSWFKLNNNLKIQYSIKLLPDSTTLISFVKINNTHPVTQSVVKTNIINNSLVIENISIMDEIDKIVPQFQKQFQYRAASISVVNSGSANINLPSIVFQDCLKSLLSLIALCVKVKSEVKISIKSLTGYTVLNAIFVLSKEMFHVLPSDLTCLPGITSLVRQYSKYVKLDVELTEGDTLNVSMAFFNHV